MIEKQRKDTGMRSITYHIKENRPGQKVSGFLKEKGYSEQNLVNLKKDEESILVNGVFMHQNYVLREGDVLEVRIREKEKSENILPVELPLDILYEDEDLLVVNKAAGMPIHPSRNNYDNSLGNALAWYYREQNRSFVFRCINRLDRDTSGLTIVAKHMVSAAILSRMVANKSEKEEICREYLAIVRGHVLPEAGTIDAPIARKESRCLERVVDYAQGERAVTHYRVEKEHNGYSLVRLKLETGRTHQIRVHMSYLGYPLVGDFLYNPAYAGNQKDRLLQGTKKVSDGSYELNRQALHAYRLAFRHPMTGELMDFTTPLPSDMERLIT